MPVPLPTAQVTRPHGTLPESKYVPCDYPLHLFFNYVSLTPGPCPQGFDVVLSDMLQFTSGVNGERALYGTAWHDTAWHRIASNTSTPYLTTSTA